MRFSVAFAFLAVSFAAPARCALSADGEIAGLNAKFVDVNGIRTRYYEMGQGEAIVLVHGGGWSGYASANEWSKNIPGLARRFHVYAPDKLGSGMTDNPKDDNDYNLQGGIDHLYQFILTLKLGKVHLVGSAQGGGDVLFLALEHPEVVKSLVISDSMTAAPVGPLTYPPEALAKCPNEPDWEQWKCRMQAITFRPDLAFDDEYFEAGKYMASLPKAQETAAKVKASAPLFDPEWKMSWLDRVKSKGILQVPVLLYWGRNDPSATIQNGLALFDVLGEKNPRVRMIIVNKAGHYHFREYPEEFNHNVIRFLRNWKHEADGGASHNGH